MQFDDTLRSRRAIIGSAVALGAFALGRSSMGALEHATPATADRLPMSLRPQRVFAAPKAATARVPHGVDPKLFDRAIAALDRHGDRIKRRDLIAVADFTAPSSDERFQFVNLEDGRVTTMLVAHGSGSDPSHCGKLQRFSNTPDSNATSEGAYLTSDYYVGKHDRSQRLIGLDPTNDNALARAIVIHGAWYSNPDMLRTHGKLGRSQGCLAVAEKDLPRVFDMMGQGRMIYAGRA